MINKKETQLIETALYKNAKNVANLIINKDIKSAYIKYETVRQFANILGTENIFNREIKDILLKTFKKDNVNLFFESFGVNYTDYKNNEYGITDYEILER
ncbi:hypothetical protein [Clostridium tagluense]|uniref:Uncharacterized protein n=1 Tax=Clostridium tagluense TaxID=360422 RepID=A0A401USR5_9CLOT|nr:hypothetical protein [Clostridium tagluense]GCD12595.1 hypothetical protein Ctaglu_42180 [Clostridium tagluense]